MDVKMHIDANAAKGIVESNGSPNVKHIDLNHLWIQQEQAWRILPLAKVDGCSTQLT